MESRTRTVIPAAPGWFVVLLCGDGLVKFPIVAWEVERHESPYHRSVKRLPQEMCVTHHLTPLTAEGNHDDERYAILSPDGTYDIPMEGWCNNPAECLRMLKGDDEAKPRPRGVTAEEAMQ